MGLSDEERTRGIMHAIQQLNTRAKWLVEKGNEIEFFSKTCLTIAGIIKTMWHGFFGRSRNTAHWIFGPSTLGRITAEKAGPWPTPIVDAVEGIFLEENEEECDKDQPFNVFDGMLSVEAFLRHTHDNHTHPLNAIYDILGWTEQLSYYLRRYNDQYKSKFDMLDECISNIYGEAFSLFNSHKEECAKAYLLNRICIMLYGEYYYFHKDKLDAFHKWALSTALHHDLLRPMKAESLKWVARMHLEMYTLFLQKKLTIVKRCLFAMKLAGGKFHYQHAYNALLSAMKADKLLTKEVKDCLDKQFAECSRLNEEYKKSNEERLDREYPGDASIYGYEYDDQRIRGGLNEKK